MFFSKIEVNGCGELMDWLKYNPFNSYTIHKLLWQLFPENPDAKRTFIFREEQNPQSRLPMFYMVSREPPTLEKSFLHIVGIKKYSPKLHVGEKFAFTVRINPVVSRMTKGRKRSQKHDIWVDAKKRGKAGGLSGFELTEFMEGESKNWLVVRAGKLGFSLEPDNIFIEGYRSYSLRKTVKGREIRYGALDFKGVLRISDTERFGDALFNGIGRSKAFGCGLMMVKRVHT